MTIEEPRHVDVALYPEQLDRLEHAAENNPTWIASMNSCGYSSPSTPIPSNSFDR